MTACCRLLSVVVLFCRVVIVMVVDCSRNGREGGWLEGKRYIKCWG
jgi:hypothetical protein